MSWKKVSKSVRASAKNANNAYALSLLKEMMANSEFNIEVAIDLNSIDGRKVIDPMY